MYDQTVKCEACGNNIDVNVKDSICTSQVSKRERGMGNEICHIVEIDHLVCPYCGAELEITGQFIEYPEGCCETTNLLSRVK